MYVFSSFFCIPLVKGFIICPLQGLLSSFFCLFNTFFVTKVIFLPNQIIILPKCMSDFSFPTSNTLTAPVAYRCSEQLSVGFKMLHHVAQSFLLVVSTASLQTSSVTSHWDYHPNRSALSHLCAFEMLFSFPLPCLLTYLGCCAVLICSLVLICCQSFLEDKGQ